MSTWKNSWSDYPIVVLAMNTTTSGPLASMPFEIAAVRLDQCKITARVSSYCDPGVKALSPLHRSYDQKLLEASPDPATVLTAVLGLAGSQDAVLAAWDAQFVGTLAVRLSKGKQLQTLIARRDWLNVEVWAGELYPVPTLEWIADTEKLPLDPRSPLSRAEATAKILCSDKVQALARGTLIEVLAQQKRLQLEQSA